MTKSNLIIGLLAFIGFVGMSFTNPFSIIKERLNVNTTESTVTWKGYKVGGEHTGTIAIKNGALDFNDGALTGGSFDIDMTTLKTTDLEGDWAAKLDGHLKSPDFFGVESYPTAKFLFTKVISRGKASEYKIVGDLTIKETTKEIKFLATATQEENKATATAKITIDRSDFDIRYGSGSFFDNLGDKTIYDEFDLDINIVVNK